MCCKTFCFYIMLLVLSNPSLAKPFTPESDDQVLEQLPRVLFQTAEKKKIKQLRVILNTHPDDWQTAKVLVQHYINLAHDQSDPRYMGYAQALLKPWWHDTQPPLQVLIMRAVIKQYEHDFHGANTDLDQLLRVQPYHVQANLMKATILTVLGNYQTAIEHCQRLLRKSSLVLSIVCQSTPLSLSGQAESSYLLLKKILLAETYLESEEKRWAWTALAEIAWRLGKFYQAEQHFQSALKTTNKDNYLFRVYADFLLQQQRPLQVIALLTDKTQIETLLLRLALAEQMTNSPKLDDHIALLQERFEANRKRGSSLHKGDEARFLLYLLNKPQQALQLAKQNWLIQRESADTYILLQTAIAVDDKKTVDEVKQWLAEQSSDDVFIQQLLSEG